MSKLLSLARLRLVSISTLASVVFTTAFSPVSAYPVSRDVEVWIDGQKIYSPADMKPYINQDGRTMLSVRDVTEALGGKGCSIAWLASRREVEIQCFGQDISFWFDDKGVGNIVASVNGRDHRLLTRPELTNNRAYLGLRDLGNLLDVATKWDPDPEDPRVRPNVAALLTDQVPIPDAQDYARAVALLQDYTDAEVLPDDTVAYTFNPPEGTVFPADIPAYMVEAYVRSLEDSQDMQRIYTEYAYEDPGDGYASLPPSVASESTSQQQSVLINQELASAKTLAQQRHLAAVQIRQKIASAGNTRLKANDTSLMPLRRYRTRDGVFVEVWPSGEKHYLDKAHKNDLLSKFTATGVIATLLSGATTVVLKEVAKAWPYGTAAVAVVSAAVAAHAAWINIRIRDYCSPSGTKESIVMKYAYLRLPTGLSTRLDAFSREQFGFDPGIRNVKFNIATDCEPWNGVVP